MLSSRVSRFSFHFFDLTVLKNFVRNPFKLPEIFGYRIFLCMRTENHVPPSKFCVSQYAKNSWERLLRFKMFGISETFLNFTFFLRFFCLTVAKNFVRNHLMFQTVSNVRYRKNLCKRTEYHDLQSKIFCLRVPKDFRCGKLRCIRKVRLSKKFMPKRVISLFSVDFFSRILRIKFVTESLFVSESLGHRKLLCSVGGVAIFRWFFMTSQY